MMTRIKMGDYVVICRRGRLQGEFGWIEKMIWDTDEKSYNITLAFLDGETSSSWSEEDVRAATEAEIAKFIP